MPRRTRAMRGSGFLQDHKGTIDAAYDTTAAVGKVGSVINAIFATLVCLIVVVIGVFLVRRRSVPMKKTLATVVETNCEVGQAFCDAKIEYKVDGKTYSKVLSGKGYNKGSTMQIRYNPENPDEFDTGTVNVKMIGWIMIIVGVLLIVMSWVTLWFVLKFKVLGAATGVGIVADAVIPD